MGFAAVLDTSAAMAFFLSDEEGASVGEKLDIIFSANGQVFVPPLFWYEVGNVLVTAAKRNRITMDEIRGIEQDLSELPLVTDSFPGTEIRMRIREIARERNLSYYDASYLELSDRLDIPLLTLDKKLLESL